MLNTSMFLCAVADAARDEFNSADSKYRSIENEIK